MIYDYDNNPRYFDKQWEARGRTISPELKKLIAEMEQNPRFHISKEFNFYPRGFPSHSPGWS
jgi:hypothetical protein